MSEKILDKGVKKIETAAGIKRKAAVLKTKKTPKPTRNPSKKKKHGKSLSQHMSEYE